MMISNLNFTKGSQPQLEGNSEELELARILEDYLADVERGAAPDRQTLLARHPGLSQPLGRCLDSLELVERLGCQVCDQPLGARAESSACLPAQLGDFRIRREIGRGGMGIVYEAEQLSLGRHVAVKVFPFAAILDRRQLQRFQNEARAAAALDHPGIVSVYWVGCERGVYYYVMQLVEGQSLAEVIRALRERKDAGSPGQTIDHTPSERDEHACETASSCERERAGGASSQAAETLRITQAAISTDPATGKSDFYRGAVRLGIQAAEALQYAHGHGVLHRDVKPSNLMVDDEGKVTITDFGLARIQSDPGMTAPGDVVGTLRYMSPEQADGRFVDERTDIYSLGVTLYELLTLGPPFRAAERQEPLRQIADEMPRPLRQMDPAIPRELETIVGKAISKEPNERYASAGALADDLRCFLAGRPIHARSPTLTDRLVKWLRRHPGLVLASLAASLLVMLTLGVSTALVWQAKQEAQIARRQAEEEKASAEQKREEINAVLRYMVDDVLLSAADDSRMTIREAMKNAEQKLDQAFADQPLVGAHVRFTMCKVFRGLRLDVANARQSKRAYELYLEHQGPEAFNTLLAARDLGQALKDQGDLEEAIELYETILPIERRVLLEDDSQILYSILCLGDLLHRTGECEAGKKLLEEALEWCRLHREAEDNDTLIAQEFMGKCLRDMGEMEAARELLEATLRTSQRARSPEHPATLEIQNDLAVTMVDMGDVSAARKLQEQVLEMCQRDCGPEHPRTIKASLALARTLGSTGELAKACELQTRVLKVCDRLLGPEHLLTLVTLNNLTNTQKEMGNLVAARPLAERAVAGYEKALGPDDWHTLDMRANLAGTRFMLGEKCEAISELEQVVERSRRVLGFHDPTTLEAMNQLGATLGMTGELTAARDILERVLQERQSRFGAEADSTIRTMGVLAEVLQMLHENARARSLLEKQLEIRTRTLGPGHPDTKNTLNEVVETYFNQSWEAATSPNPADRNPALAVRAARKAIELMPEHANAWDNLGVALYRNECWEEAIEALEKAREMRGGKDPVHQFFLAMAYWQNGQQDEGLANYKEAVQWMLGGDRGEEQRRFHAEAEEVLGLGPEERIKSAD